jgi:hypothetical protein
LYAAFLNNTVLGHILNDVRSNEMANNLGKHHTPTILNTVQPEKCESSVYKFSVQTQCSSHQHLIMGSEKVPETQDNSTLTRLITEEDFSECII